MNTDLQNAIEDLIYYCDSLYHIISDSGYHGKAEALETRYLKLGSMIGLKTKKETSNLNENITTMITEDTKIHYIELDKNTTPTDLKNLLNKIIANVKAEPVEPIEKVHQDFYHFAKEYLYDDYYKSRENLLDTHERTADGSNLPKLPTPPCIDDILNLARKLSKELRL